MMLAIYVGTLILSLLPFSLLMRYVVSKSGTDLILQELSELSSKVAKLSPKEKRMRLIRGRYEYLRKRIRGLFMVNLFVLWLGIFVSMIVANIVVAHLVNYLNIERYFYSPLRFPGIVLEGYRINVLIVIMAVIIMYQPVHNRISLMYKLYGV